MRSATENRYHLNSFALIPLTLACAAIATPWLMSHSPVLAFALQRAFALVCHQHADRSFILFGGTVAVCARCLGVYLGAAVGLLSRVPRRVAWQWLIAAVGINFADWLAEFAGLHGNWIFERLALGIALGATAAMLVTAGTARDKIPTQANEAYRGHSPGGKT